MTVSTVEKEILTDLGLSDVEARVYLGALRVGEGTVLEISRESEVKRSTCYKNLDDLTKRGFVSRLKKKGVIYYAAEDPRVILNSFEAKIENFKDFLPFYRAQLNKGRKPQIYFYEGKEELERAYKYSAINKKTKFAFGLGTDIGKLDRTLPGIFDFWEKKYFGKLETKEIVSYNKSGIEYGMANHKKRPIKVMPKNLPAFSDTMITDTNLLIVSLDNMFGILIESEDLAKTYKNFFLLAWEAALDVKDCS